MHDVKQASFSLQMGLIALKAHLCIACNCVKLTFIPHILQLCSQEKYLSNVVVVWSKSEILWYFETLTQSLAKSVKQELFCTFIVLSNDW